MNEYIINTTDIHITQLELLIRLLVACGIGLLLGLEREYSALHKKEQEFAGIRTFVLLALTGFTGTALHFLLSPWVFAVILISVMTLIGISYWITSQKGDIGATSELAGLLTIVLGALSFLGLIELSLMITVIILVLLSTKVQLMNVIGKIKQEEIYALVQFVVVALLIYPFLPDQNFGPYDAINPKEVGLVVILTSGIGFLGYVLMRVFGTNKGTILTGIIGGLVSSTMVTWIFARKSKEQTTLTALYTSAILAASTVMVLRVFLWVILFNRALLPALLLPLGLLFITAVGGTIFFYKRDGKNNHKQDSVPLGKPLDLLQAIVFGILYIGIVLVIYYANDYFGEEGIFVTSGIAGTSDVDAITISISKMSVSTIEAHIAINAILIATTCNTIAKFTIAFWAGSRELKRNLFIGYGAIFVAALVAFVIYNL